MLWLEVQEGRNNMGNKEFQKEMGETTACVLRGEGDLRDSEPFLMDVEEEMQKRIYIVDSWFGSIKTAASL